MEETTMKNYTFASNLWEDLLEAYPMPLCRYIESQKIYFALALMPDYMSITIKDFDPVLRRFTCLFEQCLNITCENKEQHSLNSTCKNIEKNAKISRNPGGFYIEDLPEPQKKPIYTGIQKHRLPSFPGPIRRP